MLFYGDPNSSGSTAGLSGTTARELPPPLPPPLPPNLAFGAFFRYHQLPPPRYQLVPGAWEAATPARTGGTTGYPSGTTASAGTSSGRNP